MFIIATKTNGYSQEDKNSKHKADVLQPNAMSQDQNHWILPRFGGQTFLRGFCSDGCNKLVYGNAQDVCAFLCVFAVYICLLSFIQLMVHLVVVSCIHLDLFRPDDSFYIMINKKILSLLNIHFLGH